MQAVQGQKWTPCQLSTGSWAKKEHPWGCFLIRTWFCRLQARVLWLVPQGRAEATGSNLDRLLDNPWEISSWPLRLRSFGMISWRFQNLEWWPLLQVLVLQPLCEFSLLGLLVSVSVSYVLVLLRLTWKRLKLACRRNAFDSCIIVTTRPRLANP